MAKKTKTPAAKLDFDALQKKLKSATEWHSRYPSDSALFLNMVASEDGGLGWLGPELEKAEKQLRTGSVEASLVTTWTAIIRLARERAILAKAAASMKPLIGEPVVMKELKRKAGRIEKAKTQSSDLRQRVGHLYAEAEKKKPSKKTAVYREIAKSLDITIRTVQRYLKTT